MIGDHDCLVASTSDRRNMETLISHPVPVLHDDLMSPVQTGRGMITV